MKAKTFILTFLMMMSSPFLFGQHWTDPGELYQPGTMQFTSKIYLDNELQTNTSYEIAVFNGTTLLEVANIVAIGSGENTLYHVDLNVQGSNGMGDIYFKLYNGEKEFVSVEKIQFQDHGSGGTHINPSEIHFKTVAQIEDGSEINGSRFDVVYPSLQKAIDACKEGDNTIGLLADNAEDVTIKQVEGVNVTIDGGTSSYEYSGTITIHGNARHDGAETLTFQNINFKTDKAGHYFIDSNSTGSVERYAHNVTVSNCNFTAKGAGVNSAAAMRIRQGFDIAINGSTFTNLHSALQAYGNAGITVSGITLNGKNGISAGTSTGVVIENSNIIATGYGVRADGTGAYDMTLSGANTITADLPVVVRNTTGAYELKVESGTTLNGNPAVTFTTGDDGTFVAPTSPATSDLADGISTFGFEAKIGTVYHTTFVNAYAAAAAGDVITLLKDQNFSEIITLDKAITLDGGNYKLTSTAGRAINVDCAGEVTIKNLTIVGSTGCERGINIIDQAGITNIENVTISGQSHYAVHMATSAGAAKVNVKNSNLTGYGAFVVYGKGSENTIENSTLVGINTYDDNGSNNFGTIVADVENTTITVTGGNITAKAEEGKAGMAIFTGKNGNNANVTLNSTLALEGAAKYIEILNETTTLKVKGEYATAIQAEGFATSDPDNGLVKVEGVAVAKIGETKYATLAKAITAAQPGNTIVLLADITEDVSVGKSLTIDGENNTYTGKMEMKANITVKNVNFDGKGYNGYAVETRSASVVVIEDCTAKNYGYGFLQIASNNHTTTVKNVTISNVNYGVKVDYSNGVVLENVDINAAVAAVLNSNYGTKTISIKNSELNILGTWERNGTVKTTYNFYGDNTIDEFVTVADIDTFVLAATDATLTAPEGLNVTTSVVNSLVKYENEKYVVKPAVAKIGEKYYETLTEAINAADDGATIQLLPVTINEYVAPWITDTQHTSEKSITILGSKDDEGKLATTLTAGMYLGYEDGQCREHTIVVKDVKFEGKGLKVACQQKVTIEGNQFNDITEGQAIAVVGKNIESVVKYNVIDNVAAAQGIELRNTLTATVEGNIISNTGHNALQITSQVGATASEIDVINNTMSNWGKGGEGRAMRINDIVTANINGNVMSHTAAPEEFVKVTGSTTLDASANYWNGVSPLTDGMFTGVEGDLVPVLKSYYTDAEKQNLVVLSPSVAKIGEEYYPSLAAAVSAAQPDNNTTIELLKDITENVTVNKNVTIDGGDKNYTGTMTISSGKTVTVQNVNFVKGCIDKIKGTSGTLTVMNCNFDGVDNSIAYAVTVRGGDKLTIENSTAKNYSYGMLYIPSAVANIAIKDVEVSNVTAAFNISYSGDGTFENVEVDNVTYGLHVQNYGSRTFTLKDCVMNNVNYPTYIQQKSTAKVTFEFNNVLGYKETINSGSNQAKYGKYVLTSTAAKLTNVPDDFNVTVSKDLADNGYVVEYNEGVYSVVAGNVLNSTTGKKYATIQDAIDAAQDNDNIVVLKDLTVDKNDAIKLNSYNTFFKVENKIVTIDLNGCDITGDVTGLGIANKAGLVGLFSTNGQGHLTLEDSKGGAEVKIDNATETDPVYYLISCFDGNKGSITINGGSYSLNAAQDALIHSAGDECVTINGGNFYLGNIGTSDKGNGHPWIVNVNGSNKGNITINGGTFNDDMNHQFWANEVYVPETLALKNNGNGTWTVVESVAYVEEIATSTSSTVRKVGYATIEDAIEAIGIRNTNKTVTMLEDVELENPITIAAGKEVILDLNGKVVSYESAVVGEDMITNKGKLTIESSVEGGKLTYKNTDETGANVTISTISTEPGSELIINGGIIENTSLANNTSKVLVPYTIDILTNGNLGDVTVTINGGSIISENYIAIRQFVNGNVCNNSLTVKGGSITAKKRAINVQDAQGGGQVKNCAKLHVEKGEITATEDGGYSICNFANSENISVIGGTFVGAVYSAVNGIISGGTFDAEPYYAYCAEGFAAVDNGDGTWTVMPSQEQTLGAGYNWYSSYLNIETDNLLEALGESGISVAGNDWIAIYYTPVWDYDDHTLDFSKMYMIETNQEHTLKLTGKLLNAGEIDIDIEQGWNWIGYPSNERVEINTALTNHSATDGDRIVTQGGFVEYASMYGGWIGSADFTHFEPTKGYQYFSANNDAVEFKYNIVPAQTRGNNETTVATHYSVDYTKYPFNMTMVAVVDGAMNDNYEVAALVNGEVRGSARPVYVEALDTYMLFLTISGDEVEEVSFKYYDITTEEEYELVNRIEYSNNAMVGSVNEPYVLSRGTTGIGEAAMSNINIYPNPTTTGTEINLQATCDKVEVYNALGVKVAEYQNVDTIDALETAGIYVIRITNDGNVQNCRLVVK